MTTMEIRIEPAGFLWNGVTKRHLFAPEIHDEGIIRVYRAGQVFDTAYVGRPSPTKDSVFYGFQKVVGIPYVDAIRATFFALGDRLEIDIPAGVSEVDYWQEMQQCP